MANNYLCIREELDENGPKVTSGLVDLDLEESHGDALAGDELMFTHHCINRGVQGEEGLCNRKHFLSL